jgi:hypothetical protein
MEAVSCQQLELNIKLLRILREVPAEQKRHGLPSVYDHGRVLTLEHEIEIADNLAFLSASTGDNDEVTAVCVEENPSGDGLRIRVASNSGSLEEVCSGFTKVATILEKAALRRTLFFCFISAIHSDVDQRIRERPMSMTCSER